MRKAMRRTAAAIGVLVAGAALPLVVTAPAQASANDCVSYLQKKGYIVGPKAGAACAIAASHESGVDIGICIGKLFDIGVRQDHASEACGRGF